MTDATLRFGIMGTGNIARQFAQGVAEAKHSGIAAVASRSAERAQTFAQAHDIATAHGEYQALLDDEQVEAVYISLPNAMHHEWTIKALEAGKHVLCEKPLAADATEAQQMFAAAEQHDRLLIEAFMYRTHPLTAAVLDTLASGTIGRLQMVRTSFSFRTRNIEGNIRFSPELAGGALMDVGCYCIDFALLCARAAGASGAVTRATAVGRLHESGVDDLVAGSLELPGGLLVSFVCGMSAQMDNSAYLCGDEGFIQVPVPWKPPVRQARYLVSAMTPPRMDQVRQPPKGPQEFTVDAPCPLYGMEADAFAAAVRGDAEPFITPEQSLTNMRLLDELRKMIR